LILQMNFHASSKFKFVVTPRSSSVIHFMCASLEIEIGHENLNFVWAFTTDAFPQMFRSWWSYIFGRNFSDYVATNLFIEVFISSLCLNFWAFLEVFERKQWCAWCALL
jgi:hypothetical protein